MDSTSTRPYETFAERYDELMAEVPYDEWVTSALGLALPPERLDARVPDRPASGLDVLDLACGTGTTSYLLALRGHRVVAMDLAEPMLAVASSKVTPALSRDQRPVFVHGDMRDLDLPGRFDLVTCFCDGLNHLSQLGDLRQVFRRVRHALRRGGTFVFDLNTPHKLREVLGDNTFFEEFEGGSCIMDNQVDMEARFVSIRLVFFLEEPDGRYRKAEEEHTETWFSDVEIAAALGETGLSMVGCWDGYGLAPVTQGTDRAVYCARAV